MATQANFLLFIRNTMQINTTVLPDASTDITNSYNLALEFVDPNIQSVSTISFDNAVYNLAGHFLIEFANDQPNQTYFVNARKSFDITGFVPGVIQSTSDQGTSESLTVPQFFETFQMSDLDMMRTPWGRQYISYSQKLGFNWGLT